MHGEDDREVTGKRAARFHEIRQNGRIVHIGGSVECEDSIRVIGRQTKPLADRGARPAWPRRVQRINHHVPDELDF